MKAEIIALRVRQISSRDGEGDDGVDDDDNNENNDEVDEDAGGRIHDEVGEEAAADGSLVPHHGRVCGGAHLRPRVITTQNIKALFEESPGCMCDSCHRTSYYSSPTAGARPRLVRNVQAN